MKEIKYLRLVFGGKIYQMAIKTLKFSENFIISKLQIGYSHHWLVWQQGSWLLIGNISLCKGLQKRIIHTITELHDFGTLDERLDLKVESSYKSNLITSAILKKLMRENRINYHDK